MPIYTGGSTAVLAVNHTIPPSLIDVNSILFEPYRQRADGALLVDSAGVMLLPVTSTTPTAIAIPSSSAFSTAPTSGLHLTTGSAQTVSTSSLTVFVSGTSYYVVPSPDGVIVRASPRFFVPPRSPVVKKSTKNSIKRALKLMFNVGFEEEAKIFLRGETVEVSHPDSLFKFVIQRYQHSLILRTEYPGFSTPYSLSLYTKSDVKVANLCVYVKDTPLLDQVLALAMFIKSGSEEMILTKANWSCLTPDAELKEIIALEYPKLRSKMRY